MSVKYLNKFAQKINKRQVDQVLQHLNEKRQAGEIRTVDEFLSRLQDLVRDLSSTTLSPTLNMFPAVENEVIDSETYNHMLDRIRDDFRSAFEEADNIDEVRQSHQAIMRDVILKNLRRAIDEIESKVDLYENKWSEYGAVSRTVGSSFKEVTANRTKRNIQQFGTIFSDPRSEDLIEQDAIIEEVGDRLTLSKSIDEEYKIKEIKQVFDTSSPQSKLIVQLPSTSIDNIIDQQQYTYWIQSLLFENIQAYAKIKLELTISTEKDINYVEIEPITDKGLILETIEYEDTAFTIQTIHNTDIVFTSPIRVNFSRTPARKLFITFRNENGIPIDFTYKQTEVPLFSQAIEQSTEESPGDISSIYSDLDRIISSATVKDIIGIVPASETEFSGYSYTFGIDNIRTGLTLYDSQSIYVSKPIELNREVGQAFLKAEETRPKASSPSGTPLNTSTTYDGSDSDFYFSSIEYLVIKRDFDIFNNIINTSRYALIPHNRTRIHHERLPLTEKSVSTLFNNDIGNTLLFTDKTVGDVKVYRNGSLLTYGVDWFDVTSTSNKTPNSDNPMVFKIRIENPLAGDIYTVTYTPMKSTTRGIPSVLSSFTGSGVDVVDMEGDLSVRYLLNNNILFNQTNFDTVFSQVFLCIILKNNSSRNALSAAVEDYKLFIGTKEELNV
jgi:hypothetical protein